MTVEVLAGIVGTIASLAFAFIPGLRVAFAKLSSEAKSGIMALVLLIVSGVIVGMGCAGIWVVVACDKVAILEFVKVVGLALIANQSVYSILPEMNDVKLAKAQR